MTSLSRSILSFAMLLVFVIPGAAQQQMKMPKHETKSAAPYHPGLGELMTAFVQPRHIKLGLAGAAQNWAYAAYELGELIETFDDVAEQVPRHGDLDIPAAIASSVKPALTALDAAIKAKEARAFTQSYADLTASCNACHQSADHPMIVIKVPNTTSFPDQDFRPPMPK